MYLWKWFAIVCLGLSTTDVMKAQEPAPAPAPDALRVTSQLVVLDATVLDKAGRVVTQPLTRDDFQIEEDKKPQTIYSFESAAEHVAAAASGEKEKTPQLIFVLDEMNYHYESFHGNAWNIMEQLNQYVYEREELAAYLRAQPEKLTVPVTVLSLTHHGFHILVRPTYERDVVLERVKRHDPGLGSPFRDYLEQNGGDGTSTRASLQALWALALQQRAVPGRKIVVWLGVGGPEGELKRPGNARLLSGTQPYQRVITDMLVDARITLDVIGPGIGSAAEAAIQPGTVVREMSSYHFDAGFGFSGYVAATGGLRKNRNDVRAEIHTSVEYGTAYYTISYRPSLRDFDGQFRRIHVTVKGHPEWTVLTKAGYYGMQFGGEKDAEHQQVSDLSMATFEPMPFEAIGATLIKIERIKNTGKTRFTFQLDSEDLQWNADSTTKVRETDVTVSGAALGSVFLNKTLASEISTWKLTVPLETDKQPILSEVAVTLQIPPKTERLRFAVRDAANGRMGTVDLNPKAVVGAPEVDAPIPPVLTPRVAAPGR